MQVVIIINRKSTEKSTDICPWKRGLSSCGREILKLSVLKMPVEPACPPCPALTLQ